MRSWIRSWIRSRRAMWREMSPQRKILVCVFSVPTFLVIISALLALVPVGLVYMIWYSAQFLIGDPSSDTASQ